MSGLNHGKDLINAFAGAAGIQRPSDNRNGNNGGDNNKGSTALGVNVPNPGMTSPALEDEMASQGDKHLDEQRNARDEGLSDTEDIFNRVKQTPDTDLNKWNRSNYAQDGGQFGNLNGMQFDDTLKLSREADAYNNRPTEQVRDWRPGGSTNIGSVSYVEPYNRPKIETEEMREMQKARQLDLNQKQMAQQLQAAVNAKDYDAFKQMYQQMFGIELNKYQLDSAMRDFYRKNYITLASMKDHEEWAERLKQYFGIENAKIIYNLSLKNYVVGMYFANLMMGMPVADIETVAKQQYINAYMQSHGNTPQALNDAERTWATSMSNAASAAVSQSDVASTGKGTAGKRNSKFKK